MSITIIYDVGSEYKTETITTDVPEADRIRGLTIPTTGYIDVTDVKGVTFRIRADAIRSISISSSKAN